MASSRGTLNGPDMLDVGVIMRAFEEINQVELLLIGKVALVGGIGVLDWELTAFSKEAEIGDQPSLASQRFRTGLYPNQTMEAVIMMALYGIDAALARDEMDSPSRTA